jgi:hypothetical protein
VSDELTTEPNMLDALPFPNDRKVSKSLSMSLNDLPNNVNCDVRDVTVEVSPVKFLNT